MHNPYVLCKIVLWNTIRILTEPNLFLSWTGADGLMGVYLFVIGAYDLKFRGEYNRHAQAWMDSLPCQVVGSLAMLSTEVSVLLLTYLTLEKYICIVYPFRYLTPGRRRTVTILVAIWILGFIIAFLPLVCKGVFRNFYGTNGVCFPLHSEQPETTEVQIYSIIIFLGESGAIKERSRKQKFEFIKKKKAHTQITPLFPMRVKQPSRTK